MSLNGFFLVIHSTDEHQGLLRHQKFANPPKRHWLPPCAQNPGEGKEERKKIKGAKRKSNLVTYPRRREEEMMEYVGFFLFFFFFFLFAYSLSLIVEHNK